LAPAERHWRRGELADRLGIAAEALGRYKLRTFLSVIGVVLGVSAVIAMMSVSEGARLEALQQVESLGLDNLVARNRPLPADGSRGAGSGGLTAADAARLPALVPGAAAVSPLKELALEVSSEGRGLVTAVVGVRPDYQRILRLEIGDGRFLSAVDDRPGARVCVLGAAIARRLFGYRRPIGEHVRLQGEHYLVVGVIAETGRQSSAIGALAWRDLSTAVFVPLSALSGRSLDVDPAQRVDEIWLQARHPAAVDDIGGMLQSALIRLHGGRPDVEVIVPRELLAQRYRTQRTFSVVVGSIAAIALLVGGIGIMNIMLTSVVERTHEIGIRRTVGATRRDVSSQFLLESLMMTLTGGVLGILIGVGVAMGITSYAGWRTFVSPLAIVLAVAVSAAVGLGFGIYPAVKAARLQPVDAVRYE
jgi:putative ABC transport system permease protein